jgi:peptidoglycan/LPS O-acetylase OafA/YrhL
LAISLLIVGAALLFWLQGYHKPAYHPPVIFPYKPTFWSFFLNVVASGLGVQRISTAAGVICLLLVVLPICGIVWRKRSKMSVQEWVVVSTILALLANQCAVTMGRAGFGIGDSKNVEYTEIGVPLLLLLVAAWFLLLKNRRRIQLAAVATLWLFFFGVFWQKWGDFDVYQQLRNDRLTSLKCVQDYYAGRGDGHCPTTYPADRSIAPFLDQGKRLNASFYRDAISDAR